MLSGWYCRSLATEQSEGQQMDSATSDDEPEQDQTNDAGDTTNANKNVDHRTQYKYLKRKLKYLIYENEFFQDALRSNQRRLVKVTRDRAFLLDRLMQYEKPENTSSESATESSEDELTKKRKLDQEASGSVSGATATPNPRGRKKKLPTAAAPPPTTSGMPPGAEKAANELLLHQHHHTPAHNNASASQQNNNSSSINDDEANNISMEQPPPPPSSHYNNCTPAEYNN